MKTHVPFLLNGSTYPLRRINKTIDETVLHRLHLIGAV